MPIRSGKSMLDLERFLNNRTMPKYKLYGSKRTPDAKAYEAYKNIYGANFKYIYFDEVEIIGRKKR